MSNPTPKTRLYKVGCNWYAKIHHDRRTVLGPGRPTPHAAYLALRCIGFKSFAKYMPYPLTQAYLNLAERVRKIDGSAWGYMLNDAPDLFGFNASGKLLTCFSWSTTPQGWDYWNEIHDAIK